MTLAEYEELLADLVIREKITIEQAQELRQRFINGEFDDGDLPLPLEQAQEKDEDSIFLFGIASFQTRQSIKRRQAIRNRIIRVFDDSVAISSQEVESVQGWHSETMRILQGAMLANWVAGNGTNAEPDIDEEIEKQLAFLYRFAGEQHVMNAVGTPMSEAQTTNRLLLYGGAVWAAWFRGNESVNYDDGYVVQYVARDDRRTCEPCRRAAGYYRIGQGPYPGEICYGGGRCRCERITLYAPEILATL